MIVLGVNGAYHENAAALVVDGEIAVAAEEERFNRRKHGSEARVDNADELPWQAIRHCLRTAGISADALDAVAFSFDPVIRREEFVPDPYATPGDWGDPDGEAAFQASLAAVPGKLSARLDCDLTDRLRWVSHHEAHAASAYYPSGFDSAAVLVVDGIGEHTTALLGQYEHGRLEASRRLRYPDSLGFLWEKLSRFLGFSEYDACKVMGLAAYGDAAEMRPAIDKLITVLDGSFTVDADLTQFRRADFDALSGVLGAPGSWRGERERSIAAALQAVTEEAMLSLACHLYDQRPQPRLCLAGGVALNCQANWVLQQRSPFQEIFVPPAPHDAGTAIGAALAVEWAGAAPDRVIARGPARSPYLGAAFDDADARSAVLAAGLRYERPADLEALVAARLAAGEVVAWFQDRMEFGPRALGNRSLLADPRDAGMRQKLNVKVKHREIFRPFAPSVLAERAAGWFDLGRRTVNLDYMSVAVPVLPERAAEVPAIVHEDGTARVQAVSRDLNPRFHRLISEFDRLTGVPMLLNTSFNDSEPIVCSPQDAVNTFLGTRIDVLVLGDLVVHR